MKALSFDRAFFFFESTSFYDLLLALSINKTVIYKCFLKQNITIIVKALVFITYYFYSVNRKLIND